MLSKNRFRGKVREKNSFSVYVLKTLDLTVHISCTIKIFQVSDSSEETLAEAIEGYNSLYGHSKKLRVKMALLLSTPFRSFKHSGTKLTESK